MTSQEGDWGKRFDEEFNAIPIKGNTLKGKCPECRNPEVYCKDNDMTVGELFIIPDIKSFIDNLLLSQRTKLITEIEWMLPEIERAHTYASENADLYRSYDAGQEAYRRRTVLALKELQVSDK